jgi:hypothetical protein
VHKRYLLERERAGVPVVPTQLVLQGELTRLRAICDARAGTRS